MDIMFKIYNYLLFLTSIFVLKGVNQDWVVESIFVKFWNKLVWNVFVYFSISFKILYWFLNKASRTAICQKNQKNCIFWKKSESVYKTNNKYIIYIINNKSFR